jgi:hypothetical protein
VTSHGGEALLQQRKHAKLEKLRAHGVGASGGVGGFSGPQQTAKLGERDQTESIRQAER